MRTNYFFLMLICLSLYFSGCKDEMQDEVYKPDFSIRSTEHFELISQYENGWIKEGRNFTNGQLINEFELYENGYIKSVKYYAYNTDRQLLFEVYRSSDNEPISSKHYVEGRLKLETTYENGLPLLKKVYNDKGVTTHAYTSGSLSESTFLSTDESKKTVVNFNKNANTRTVSTYINEQKTYESILPYEPQFGDGLISDHEVQTANPYGHVDDSYIEEGYHSIADPWEFRELESFMAGSMDHLRYLKPYILSEEGESRGKEITDYAISTELHQSIAEQYAIEPGYILAGIQIDGGTKSLFPPFALQDSIFSLYKSDPSSFKLRYGGKYIHQISYGKSAIIIGALRNLPTDRKLRQEIFAISKKKMDNLIGSNSLNLSDKEKEILGKVWFEVRLFSNLPEHRNGLIINSTEDYEQGINAFYASDFSIVQLGYTKYLNIH